MYRKYYVANIGPGYYGDMTFVTVYTPVDYLERAVRRIREFAWDYYGEVGKAFFRVDPLNIYYGIDTVPFPDPRFYFSKTSDPEKKDILERVKGYADKHLCPLPVFSYGFYRGVPTTYNRPLSPVYFGENVVLPSGVDVFVHSNVVGHYINDAFAEYFERFLRVFWGKIWMYGILPRNHFYDSISSLLYLAGITFTLYYIYNSEKVLSNFYDYVTYFWGVLDVYESVVNCIFDFDGNITTVFDKKRLCTFSDRSVLSIRPTNLAFPVNSLFDFAVGTLASHPLYRGEHGERVLASPLYILAYLMYHRRDHDLPYYYRLSEFPDGYKIMSKTSYGANLRLRAQVLDYYETENHEIMGDEQKELIYCHDLSRVLCSYFAGTRDVTNKFMRDVVVPLHEKIGQEPGVEKNGYVYVPGKKLKDAVDMIE